MRLVQQIRARLPRLLKGSGDRGFLLLGVVMIATIGGILSGVVVQEFSVITQRSREADLLFYQEQYAAAIMRYQEANGHLPTKLEDLDEVSVTAGQFIRKPYTDPLFPGSTLDDWCLIKLSAAGRVVSSCASGGDPTGLGLGSSFRLGEQASAPTGRQRNTGGVPAGQGIVGVHSKSTARAFNIVKRDEETYDRWMYTADDYEKEMTTRAIPGVTQAQGPGLGTGQQGQQPGGLGQQGTKGGSSFGNSGRRGRKR